ncbi:MAG: metallophosphoesterase family protein [Thainema sp.]
MPLNRRNFLVLTLSGTAAAGISSLTSCTRSRSAATEGQATPAAESSSLVDAAVPPVRSSPAPVGMKSPVKGDVRLAVFSDLNNAYGSTDYIQEVTDAVRLISEWEPDLVLCAGDMVAGQKRSLTQAQIQAMWNGFDQFVYAPIRQAGLPFAFTLGNHDASSVISNGGYAYALERDLAKAYWTDSNRELGVEFVDRSGFPFYYSFVQNDIFYLVWDASSATVSPQEIAWAEQSLASEAAQQAKLRLVLGHLPFYAISQGRDTPGEFLTDAEQLRSQLESYNVHTYICGHHHAYYPGRVGNLQFLHCGALGSGPRTWLGSTATAIHTLTIMDITFDETALNGASVVYTTYDMTTGEEVLLSQLPEAINGPTGQVIRQGALG